MRKHRCNGTPPYSTLLMRPVARTERKLSQSFFLFKVPLSTATPLIRPDLCGALVTNSTTVLYFDRRTLGSTSIGRPRKVLSLTDKFLSRAFCSTYIAPGGERWYLIFCLSRRASSLYPSVLENRSQSSA